MPRVVAEYITSQMKLHKIKFGAVQTWDIFLFHIFKVTLAMLMKYSTFARVSIYSFHFDELPEMYAVDQYILLIIYLVSYEARLYIWFEFPYIWIDLYLWYELFN